MRKIYFLIGLIFFILQSCDYYTSEVPVTNTEKATIDTALVGRWINAETENPGKDDYFDIIAFNDKEYLLKVPVSFNSSFASMFVFKAFNSQTENGNIFNVISVDFGESDVFSFYKFEKTDDGNMKIFYLSDDYMNVKFQKSEELLNYINTYPDSVSLSFKEFALVKKQNINKISNIKTN